MMPHTFDIMNYFLDSWPQKITCFGKGFRNPNIEDTAFVICEFPNNILTHTEISWTLPEKVRQVDLIGSKDRCAKIQCLTQNVQLFENDTEKELTIKPNNTLKSELEQFIDAIQHNSPLSNDGEIGAKVVELIEHTRKSLMQGETITL